MSKYVKILRKCHSFEAQPSRSTKKRKDEEQIMTNQTLRLKIPTDKRRRMASMIFSGRKHLPPIGIDVYAKNFYEHLIEITESCIANRQVTIRPTEPPWITTLIKKHIRMHKRAYKKTKRTNTQANWVKFRRLRNETSSMIRNSKRSYIDSLSNKLKSVTLSSN